MLSEILSLVGSIVVALGGFLGVYISNKKSTAVWQYRLEELEKKQTKHNNLIERVYELEKRTNEQEKDIQALRSDLLEIKTDIKDLKHHIEKVGDLVNEMKTKNARLEEHIKKV